MRKLSSALRPTLDERRRALAFCIGIILLIPSLAEAQSGRRPPKRTESEGVQRSSDPEPPVKASEKQPAKESTPVLLAKSNSYFSSNGNFFSDYVMEACAARLKQAATLAVEKSVKEMNRKEASDAARSSTTRHVVVIELTSERMGYDRRRDRGYYADDVVVEYTVFTPGTGKIKTSGRVYANRANSRVGGVGVPLPVPSGGPATAEYMLKHAGREVAERVIDSLGVLPPPRN
jgi:hypothetical protein